MDKLVEQDDNATQNFSIVAASHSQVTEFRKQLKIKAVQAAKAKGIYLTDAIGEKLGEAITINEPAEWQQASPLGSNSFNINISDNYKGSDGVEFKKIKLRFEVTVVFSLK